MFRILHASIERLLLWAALRLYSWRRIGGLVFMDFRSLDDPQGSDAIAQLIAAALQEAETAGPAFRSSIERHVRGIMRTRTPRDGANPNLFFYQSTFPAEERSEPRLLASRLVWAAKYFELVVANRGVRHRYGPGFMEWAAAEAQRWFMVSLPEWSAWHDRIRE